MINTILLPLNIETEAAEATTVKNTQAPNSTSVDLLARERLVSAYDAPIFVSNGKENVAGCDFQIAKHFVRMSSNRSVLRAICPPAQSVNVLQKQAVPMYKEPSLSSKLTDVIDWKMAEKRSPTYFGDMVYNFKPEEEIGR